MSPVVLASRKDSFMDVNQLENKEDLEHEGEGGGSSKDQSSLYEVKLAYGVCSSCSTILFSPRPRFLFDYVLYYGRFIIDSGFDWVKCSARL